MGHRVTKPEHDQVSFDLVDGTEYATLHADVFRSAMNERDRLRAENEHLRAALKGALVFFDESQRSDWDKREHDELRAENARLNEIFDKQNVEIDTLRGTCEWLTDNDTKNAETISKLLYKNEQLQIGLKAALDAIDWMFAAQQPLRDPWFSHRDTLIASARHALEQSNA